MSSLNWLNNLHLRLRTSESEASSRLTENFSPGVKKTVRPKQCARKPGH